jgi:hypothetical protein
MVQPRALHSAAPNREFSLPARPFSFVMRPNQRMGVEMGLGSHTRGSALVTARVGEPDLVGADRVVLLRDDHDKLPARVKLADHPGHGLSSLPLQNLQSAGVVGTAGRPARLAAPPHGEPEPAA